jgi:glycyl-tRNA synthetase
MSLDLYPVGGLRFWTEAEIELRDVAVARLQRTLRETLLGINRAWAFHRVEGPTIAPRSEISSAYGADDLWMLQAGIAGGEAAMRAETTATSYAYARHLLKTGHRMPLCVWQAGKSYRRETNDGASPAKLRFLEFWQLEFQCLYALGTKADYRTPVLAALAAESAWLVGAETRTVPSDRLPAYSEETLDIEAWCPTKNRWFEVASVSIRKDFADDVRVLEVAFGLDRLVELRGWEDKRRRAAA